MDTTRTAAHKVFIVDDSASIRERLIRLLDDVRDVAVVGEADSPGIAIQDILRSSPDAVLLDVHLIGGNGLEVLRAVHSRLPATVFVVLTNHPDVRYRSVYMAAGASYFLDKNSEFDKVAEIVSTLGNSSQH